MFQEKAVLGVGFITLMLVGTLFTPMVGYTLVGGDSMHPEIEEGCGIALTQQWNGEDSLYDETVIFNIPEEEQPDIEISENITYSPIDWFAHRIVYEYEEYDPDTAKHTITKNGVLQVKDNNGELETGVVTPQTKEDMYELEGERVFIAKGDNNMNIDKFLIHEDDVISIVDTDNYIYIQSLDSFPCSIID